MPTRPLGAQISHMLRNRGVDTIFGIPGVHNIEMYRGIEEAGLQHVLARHEQGAGFMADGYARATGRPGVAYVITGPGLTNIMTPMGQAYSDSVPMLVISSCLDETAARKGQLHQMKDQRGAAETVCDWSEEARTADAAYQLVDRALTEFQTKRKRSKHIQVPIGLLGSNAPDFPPEGRTRPNNSVAQSDVGDVAVLLSGAKRPVFVFGGAVAQLGDTSVVRQVLDKFKAVAFVTYAGRGVVDGDYPLYFGASMSRPDSATVFQEADVVIAIGTELAEVDLWRAHLGHNCHLVRVDFDPVVLSDDHRAETQIQSDAGVFLRALLDAPVPKSDSEWSEDLIKQKRARWRAEVDAERPGIVAVCDVLRDALPADTMIFSDMTQLAYVAKDVWDMPAPGLWHHPTGFGTLGYALPAAIGGKVGVGERPVVAIAGDYGFQYTVQELATAVELGLTLPIILWDNGKLREIEDSMVAAQIAPNAVVAYNPDFIKLAEAYGAGAMQPQSLSEIKPCLEAALTAKGPTIIHLRADKMK